MLQSAFPIVVFGAVAFSVVMSVVFLVSRGSVYDQIGEGGLTRRRATPCGCRRPPPGVAARPRAEQEQEIRQMLRARSDAPASAAASRRSTSTPRSRGCSAPAQRRRRTTPGLAEEVRQLVVARNERRARQGLEPLDVEAEVARTLDELDP